MAEKSDINIKHLLLGVCENVCNQWKQSANRSVPKHTSTLLQSLIEDKSKKKKINESKEEKKMKMGNLMSPFLINLKNKYKSNCNKLTIFTISYCKDLINRIIICESRPLME